MKYFASLKLTIACLLASILLVFFGTLEQAKTGLYAAQEQIFHTFFVTWKGWPIFPGGYTLGILLLANLICAHVTRFKWSWKHLGITVLHFGLILFIAGELLTTVLSNESQVALKVGEVTNYAESTRKLELVLSDLSHTDYDEVHSISASALRKGASFTPPNTPFTLYMRELYANASLSTVEAADPSSLANRGLGVTLATTPLPPQQKDQILDTMVLFVELKDGSKSLGTWLLSNSLPWPQLFRYQGKEYSLSLRRARTYFPFTLELTQFIHETYPGSTIPKYFSSRLNLYDAEGNHDRSADIYMNNPLYLEGRTFYQASFGQNDTLSILQMVENVSWPLPYLSSILVAGGLVIQFIISLVTYRRRSP